MRLVGKWMRPGARVRSGPGYCVSVFDSVTRYIEYVFAQICYAMQKDAQTRARDTQRPAGTHPFSHCVLVLVLVLDAVLESCAPYAFIRRSCAVAFMHFHRILTLLSIIPCFHRVRFKCLVFCCINVSSKSRPCVDFQDLHRSSSKSSMDTQPRA